MPNHGVPVVAACDVPCAPIARNTAIKPTLELIHSLARDGLEKVRHGPMGAMGVPRPTLPQWDDIQILPARLHHGNHSQKKWLSAANW